MRIDAVLNMHEKLGHKHPYIKFIMNQINNITSKTYDEKHFQEYASSIPENLSEAFNLHLEVNLEVDNTFLMVLVYHTLSHSSDRANTIAAADFFINMTKSITDDVPQVVFDKVFEKVLEKLDCRGEIPIQTLLRFNDFIVCTDYNLLKHIEDIIVLLKSIVGASKEIIVDLESGLGNNPKPSRVGYITLKKLFEKQFQSDELSQIFLLTLTTLCINDTKPVPMENIVVFFRQVLKNFSHCNWFKKMFLKAMLTVKDPTITVNLLKSCHKEDYTAIVTGIINYYVTCTKEDRPYLQETMSLIIKDPYRHDHYDDRSRQRIVDRIVHQIFLRLGNCELTEKESIMNTFVNWYEWKDINLRITLQQMLNAQEGSITAKNMLLLLENSLDLHWQNENYNILFLKLTLNIFYKKSEYMSNRLVKMVEMLCFKALAPQVEVCLPYLVKVIQKYADKKIPAVKPLLGVLTHFALIPTQAGKKFLFEINSLINFAFAANHDANVEFEVLQILISPDMRAKQIFAALETYFSITQEQLMVLFEERTLKYRLVAWPFLCMLLDRHELTMFPAYFPHFITELDQPEFYTRAEAIYIVQAISKIFTYKLRKTLLPEDKSLAARLLNIFSKHIMSCIVPTRTANEVAMLIKVLFSVIDYNCPKLIQWTQTTLLEVIADYDQENTFLTARKLAYLSHFLIPMKMEVGNDEREKIKDILLYNSEDLLPLVLARFILFYGRISLKFEYKIDQTVMILKKFLNHTDPEVQIVTLTTLYDISNVRLQSFKMMDSELLKLIASPNQAIQEAAMKLLLELLTKDQVRLALEEMITFLLIIIDRNINVDMFLKDPEEKEQLTKCEKSIKSFFVHLLFYLNEFTGKKNFNIMLPLRKTYTYEHRCVIYRYLFGVLQRPDQLYILHILCIEFVQPLYNGALEMDFKSLTTLRDCITLISYYATENLETSFADTGKFYKSCMPKLQSLLVANYNIKSVVTEFNKKLGIVLHSLMKILCKIEKARKEMLPQIYNAISLLTIAYYENVLSIVNDDHKIRDLFCVYNTFYLKYSHVIASEPISAKIISEQEEWQQYIQSDT